MKIMFVLSALAGLLLMPSIAGAQPNPDGSVNLILVTWVQGKSGEASGATAPTIVGHFNDDETCIKAAQKARVSNGATPLMFNFICVASK